MSTHDEYSSEEEYEEVADLSEGEESDDEDRNRYDDEEDEEIEGQEYGDIPEEDLPTERRDEHEPSDEPSRRKKVRFTKEKVQPTEEDTHFIHRDKKDEELKKIQARVNRIVSQYNEDMLQALGGKMVNLGFLYRRLEKTKAPYEVDIYRPLVKERKNHHSLDMRELINEFYFTTNTPEQAEERLMMLTEQDAQNMRDIVAFYNESRAFAKLKKYYESGGEDEKSLTKLRVFLEDRLAIEKEGAMKKRIMLKLETLEKLERGEKVSTEYVLDVYKVREAVLKNKDVPAGERKECDAAAGCRDVSMAPYLYPERARDDIYDDLVHRRMEGVFDDKKFDVTPEARKVVIDYLTKIVTELIEKYDEETEEIPIGNLTGTQRNRILEGLEELTLERGDYHVEYHLYRARPVRKIIWYSNVDGDEFNLVIPDKKYDEYIDRIRGYLGDRILGEIFKMDDIYVSFPSVIPLVEREALEPGFIRMFNGASSVEQFSDNHFVVHWAFDGQMYSQEFKGPMAESLARDFVGDESYLSSEWTKFVTDRLYKKIIAKEDNGKLKGELKRYALELTKVANSNTPEKILDDLEWTYRAHVIANNAIVSQLQEAGINNSLYREIPCVSIFQLKPEAFLDTITYLYRVPLDIKRYPVFINLHGRIVRMEPDEKEQFTPINMARIIRDAVKQSMDTFSPRSHNDIFQMILRDIIYSIMEEYRTGGDLKDNGYVTLDDFVMIRREFDETVVPQLKQLYREYIDRWCDIKERYESRTKPRKKTVPDVKDRVRQSVMTLEEKLYRPGMSIEEYAKKISFPFSFLSGTSMSKHAHYFRRHVQAGTMTPASFANKSYATFFPEFYMNIVKLQTEKNREQYIRLNYARLQAENELNRQADNIIGLIYSVQNVNARYKRHGPANFDWSRYTSPVLSNCRNNIDEDVDMANVTICYDKESGMFTCHEVGEIKRLIRDNLGMPPINPLTGRPFSKKIYNKFK